MMEPKFKVGAYVRHVGKDLGTGKVWLIRQETYLNPQTNQVEERTWYQVEWMDMKNIDTLMPPMTMLTDADLEPSARAVPKFSTPEEAEAWMARQVEPGNWIGKVEDAQASIDEMLTAVVLDEAATIGTSGSAECGCLDCFTENGQHVAVYGCQCEMKDCPCCHQ